MNKEQVDLWISAPSETPNLEFKEAKKSFDKEKLQRYCVAIANEGGGFILLGISDKKPRRIVGSDAFQNLQKYEEELFINLGFRVSITQVMHPDGRVVVFEVPSRPRGTAYNFKGNYLMRSGENLVPMTEDRLRAIFAEGKPDWLEEYSFTNASEEKIIELLDTQSLFDLHGLPYPQTRSGVIDKLLNEDLIEENSDGFNIKRICAILLAKDLQVFPDLKRKAPRVIVYSGKNKLKTKLDIKGHKGFAAGFNGLVEFIMNQLPQNEIIKNALRKEVKLVPETCIRESVANALVHQDFSISGSSTDIEIYADRIEISNPGEPVVPVERFIDGYRSRNEKLTDLMRRLHICEERSSGIDRIVFEAEFYQLPAPDFTTRHNRTFVVIFGQIPFGKMDRSARIRACYQHCCLKYVTNESMTNSSLRERFKLPASKSAIVSQIIAATIKNKLIKPDDSAGTSKRKAKYLPFWS